ncbi:MAG TPA: four helix bundle protein [Anaerolineaceae bacterium]
MTPEELKRRTKQFGLRVIKVVDGLPHQRAADMIAKQLLRSGTSVGANYRSACRGKSIPDWIAKVSISIEEADESLYWMEMLVEANLLPKEKLTDLMQEANEIISILTASVKTARNNLNKSSVITAARN